MLNPNYAEAVRSIVVRALMRKITAAGRDSGGLEDGAKLLELGLIDSEDLIEVILEVEGECPCQFDPDGLDLENGLTLAGLVDSFVAKT